MPERGLKRERRRLAEVETSLKSGCFLFLLLVVIHLFQILQIASFSLKSVYKKHINASSRGVSASVFF